MICGVKRMSELDEVGRISSRCILSIFLYERSWNALSLPLSITRIHRVDVSAVFEVRLNESPAKVGDLAKEVTDGSLGLRGTSMIQNLLSGD